MVLTTNLVSYWKLEGNAIDSLGVNSNASPNATFSTANGKIGQGAGFNGSGAQNIILSNGLNMAGSPMSISMWVKPVGASGYQNLFQKRDNSGTQWQVYLHNGDTKFSFFNGGTEYLSSTNTTTGQWNHCVFTLSASSGGTINLYLNGVNKLSQGGVSLGGGTTAGVRMGQRFDTTENYNGAIDEVGIWNRELSSTEVLQLYNNNNGITYPFNTAGFFNFM